MRVGAFDLGHPHRHNRHQQHPTTLTRPVAIDMQTEKHLVTLDSATGTYLTGTTIHGSIQLLGTDKGKKIRGVSFRIFGRGRCGWTAATQPQRSPVQQSLPNDEATAATAPAPLRPVGFAATPPERPATTAEAAALAVEAKSTELALQYAGREVYVDETVFLVGTKTAPSFTVHPDNSTFEFAYALPVHLPSSFRGQYGKVKYTIEFTVHLAWRFDETCSVPLTVRHALDLNAAEQRSVLLPYQRQQTRVVGVLSSGPVSLHVYVPRCGCATGDRLPIQVIVSNRSHTHVDKVKFTLYQLVEYHSTQPARFMRTESVRVMRKEAGGVDKKSEQRYEHLLEMPDGLPATRIGTGIINIRYEIRVEAKVAGWSRNLVETVPFVVATLPYFNSVDEAPATAAAAAAAAVPPPAQPPSAIGWQPSMSTSLNDASWSTSSPQSTPTPTAYPSMQSLPNPSGSHTSSPYSPQPAYNHYARPDHHHQLPPNYAQSAAHATGPFQRGSVGSASMQSYHNASAPPLDFSTPTGSTRSSICSAAPALRWEGAAPPSYEQVYGTSPGSSEASTSSSGNSSPAAAAAAASGAGRLRRKQAPMYA